MIYLKEYKLFETGEWASDVDWQFVKDNPDDDSEEATWLKYLADNVKYIQDKIISEGDIQFEIENIRGCDMSQGPYATVTINGYRYNIWTVHESGFDLLWIDNFPINNMSKNDTMPGFQGDKYELIEAIIDHFKPINKETRRYNL